MLLKNIARSLVKHLGNAVGFGVVGDIAVDVWDRWSKEGQDQHQKIAEVQLLAQQSAAETRQEAQAVALEVAGDQTEEVQQRIQTYLMQVPAMVRRSLRRPADPTGMTVPSGLALTKPEDLLTFLPVKPSRFKIGEMPLPGVDWEMVELLGVGGFGEVWKARNPDFDGVAPVALKFCLDPEASRMLRHEATVLNQVMRQSRHPGIVQLQRTYLRADPPCLEYEYVAGGDLTGLIHDWHRSGNCSMNQVAGVMLQLAEIVGFAHRLDPPIVHRDLKPANILLQQGQGGGVQLKVADFGIGGVAASQAIKESAKGLPEGMMMTAVATGTYTPLYASPQQTSGRAADPRDDVYALGIIWYQMLTGNLNAGRPGGLRWRQKATERGMKPELVDLLERCFEDDPDDRPRDAAELAERLKRLIAPVITPPLPQPPAHAEPSGGESGKVSQAKWPDWNAALANVTNAALVAFYKKELAAGRENYLRERGLRYRIAGKRRWFLDARRLSAYVWQKGRFDGDIDFWRSGLKKPDQVKAVKDGHCLSFSLFSEQDFQFFRQTATETLLTAAWIGTASEDDEDDDDGDGVDPVKLVGPKPLNKPQLRILTALNKTETPLNRKAIAEQAHVDSAWVGDYAGFVDPEINARPQHANNLLNRGYVEMKLDKEEGHVYAITAAGKEAILKAVLTQSSSQDERDSPSQPAGEPDRLNRHSLRKKFWDGLLSRPKVKATRHADLSPVEYGWIGAGTGVRGLQLVYVTGQEEGRVEVYIDRGAGKAAENKRIFDQLQAHKSEIEVTFGGELSWQRLDEKQACRIAHTMTDGGYRSEEAKWPEIHDAMIEAMMRLEKAIIPHLENLKQD